MAGRHAREKAAGGTVPPHTRRHTTAPSPPPPTTQLRRRHRKGRRASGMMPTTNRRRHRRTPLHPRRATGRGTDRGAPAPRPTFRQGHVWVIASREDAEEVFEALLDIRRATLEVVELEDRGITNRRPHDHYATVVVFLDCALTVVCVCLPVRHHTYSEPFALQTLFATCAAGKCCALICTVSSPLGINRSGNV